MFMKGSNHLLKSMLFAAIFLNLPLQASTRDFYDRTHYSPSFGQWRHYRILLPRDYRTSGKYYPVIYYFHGHSGRFMGEQYGNGQVFLPEFIDYVKTHDVILVRWDGYAEEDYNGVYGGSPYQIAHPGGTMDWGAYFEELVAHVDSSYRTLADRQHRATCGLSMGGFMSLYISGRYPHLVGSASAYNPAHEMWVGPPGKKVRYMHKNHVLNHGHSKIRLIHASGDYIGQYHQELRDILARTPEVDFQYRRDEFNRHYVTGVKETFDFHLEAFEDVGLTAYPRSFDYDNAGESFSFWGYDLRVENKQAGFVSLRDVSRGYFRMFTRAYQPDGPPVPEQTIRLTTPPLYGNRRKYQVTDYSHKHKSVKRYFLTSSGEGRLTFTLDGEGHEVSIGNGKESRAPVLLPLDTRETPIVPPDEDIHLPLKLYNCLDITARDIEVSLASDYPTVAIQGGPLVIDSIAPGEVVDISRHFTLHFTSSDGFFQHCRLMMNIRYRGWYSHSERIDVRILPTPLPHPERVEIFDGRKEPLKIFRQAGNQGGGSILDRVVEEGTGNGDGTADPGEELTLWIQVPQGLDPFDKYTWHRTRVYTGDPYVTITADLGEPKGREWTSVQNHTSRFRISPQCPRGHEMRLVLESESYSFHWLPDTRFGKELLYQARQLHRNQLHGFTLTVGE